MMIADSPSIATMGIPQSDYVESHIFLHWGSCNGEMVKRKMPLSLSNSVSNSVSGIFWINLAFSFFLHFPLQFILIACLFLGCSESNCSKLTWCHVLLLAAESCYIYNRYFIELTFYICNLCRVIHVPSHIFRFFFKHQITTTAVPPTQLSGSNLQHRTMLMKSNQYFLEFKLEQSMYFYFYITCLYITYILILTLNGHLFITQTPDEKWCMIMERKNCLLL